MKSDSKLHVFYGIFMLLYWIYLLKVAPQKNAVFSLFSVVYLETLACLIVYCAMLAKSRKFKDVLPWKWLPLHFLVVGFLFIFLKLN